MIVNGVNTTAITKINGVALASIVKMNGVAFSTPPPPPFPIPSNSFDAGNSDSYPTSGTTWYNLTGTNNATLFNGVSYDRDGGGCLIFNGINEYGSIAYNPTFNFSTGNYTINTWVNFAAFGGNITSKDDYGANFDWCMYLPNNSSVMIYSNGAATNVSAYPSPPLSTTTWYQLTIASTSNIISIYVNGLLQNSPTYMNITNYATSYLTIGCFSWSNPNTFFNGKIAIMEYYNVGLTSNETLAYFDTTKARFGY